ncbi:MAG: efflux RND transporter periplasmic adaptor subunit [Burkholderiaceae bacterium]|jgi:membrane fusion protein (multidrug efflux system)
MNAVAEPIVKRSPKKYIFIFLLVVALLGLGWLSYYLLLGRFSEETDNAYVGGDQIVVAAQTVGTVVQVLADENQSVKAGQTLVRLDDTDARLALSQSEAQLADTIRSVKTLFDNVIAGQSAVTARQADIVRAGEELNRLRNDLVIAQTDLKRRQTAFEQGAVSAEELEHARNAVAQLKVQQAAANATLQQARAADKQANAGLASARTQTSQVDVATHPRVLQAVSRVREAYLNILRCSIVAPIDGQTAKRNVQVGSRIMPGAPLMTVISLQQLWVDANFKESQLRNIRLGQPAKLRADLYGSSRTFRGTVSGLSAGTGGAFSLLPAQNATGNWIKIVQRVPVRIAIHPDDIRQAPLRIGLSMDAVVETRDQNGRLLAAQPVASVSQTQVYDRLAAQAEKHAQDRLIHELQAAGVRNAPLETPSPAF